MDKESVLLDSEDRMDKALGALDRDFRDRKSVV